MALLTVAAGAVLAPVRAPDWRITAHALVGAALVAAVASALNRWSEGEVDARMRRTRDLRASLIDLPALLTLWLLDGIPHG
jgi:heme O synthase-like polyprenyltransferase